jgi:hypothetical protein
MEGVLKTPKPPKGGLLLHRPRFSKRLMLIGDFKSAE